MVDHRPAITIAILSMIVFYQLIRAYRVGRESKKREELFQIVTENAADMIALVDVKGNRIYNSPAYKRILGYSAAELGETSSFDQIHPEDRFKVLGAAREARNTGVGQQLEYRIRHKNGSWRVLESIAGTIRDENGDVSKLVIVNRDITDRKQAEELAEHNSLHDGMTGLPNRRLFLDRLQSLFDRCKRNPNSQYALLIVDIDGFQVFNEKMGSKAADALIVEIGARMTACLLEEDNVARPQNVSALNSSVLFRMSGDEFSVLLEGAGDPSDAMRVGRRILAAVTRPLDLNGQQVRISASIGIALSLPAHAQPDELLQEADAAMRRGKALGGSRCEIFEEGMHARAIHRMKLESDLRQAIEQNQFRIFYQPIVELSTRRITGVEALLRWQHPVEGLISPAKFLSAAEDTGLMVSTGPWVLLEACKQLRAWDEAMPSLPRISVGVNVSVKQLAHPHFIADVQAILRDTGVDASRLQIELSEQVAAADPKLTGGVLSDLHKLRVRVVLDNFGVGNSSFLGMRQLPTAALKIDRALIGEMLTDRNIQDTIDQFIGMAHKLKLQAIAEGIETVKHLETLRELGCDLGQGYLFSPPLPAEEIQKLLQEWNLEAKAARK